MNRTAELCAAAREITSLSSSCGRIRLQHSLDSPNVVNGLTRSFRNWTLLLVLMIGSAGAGAYLLYQFQINAYTAELTAENERLRQRQTELQTMIERLGQVRRLAQIVVTGQQKDAVGSVRTTDLLFVELNQDGKTVGRKKFTIPGEVAYFDGLVVKFSHDAVASARPFQDQSLVLLRRVFSEHMRPADGFPIDVLNEVPSGYQTNEVSENFQKQIWSRFWTLANDPVLAAELGVRVAQGEAVYKPMKPGVLYELTIDASSGLNLEVKPLPEAVAEVIAAAGGG